MLISKLRTIIRILRTIRNWPVYFMDYSGFTKSKYITYSLRNGVKYRVRSKTLDRVIINEIWVHKFYTPCGFKIKDNSTILDIGAQIGVFSIFASKYNSSGIVYSFEPAKENFRMLENNIKLNNNQNIVPINKAVSNKTGRIDFFINDGENLGGHSTIPSEKGNKVIVESISLEDFVKKYKIKKIDFLKMDCEGGEYDILFKCPDNILKMIEKMSIEYHDIDNNNNGISLKKFLEKKGFNVRIQADEKGKLGMLYIIRIA